MIYTKQHPLIQPATTHPSNNANIPDIGGKSTQIFRISYKITKCLAFSHGSLVVVTDRGNLSETTMESAVSDKETKACLATIHDGLIRKARSKQSFAASY